MAVLSSKYLLLMVSLVFVYIYNTRSTLLKHVYTVKTVGVTRNMAASDCQLVDLRPDFRDSIFHQLKPYYSSGYLVNSDLFWVGLARASPSDQFSWSDGAIEADLSIGNIEHIPRNNTKDNENCVAVKWSNAKQTFIVRIEPCLSKRFPFCELVTGQPDYTPLGHVYISPDKGYQVRDISGIKKRFLCEEECAKWSEIHSDECWMFTYNAGNKSCRLVTKSVMPYWEETCHWFNSDASWEAWNRNRLEVRVLDAFGDEIHLDRCALPTPIHITPEVTSAEVHCSTLPCDGINDATFEPEATSAEMGLISSLAVEPVISSDGIVVTSISSTDVDYISPTSSFATQFLFYTPAGQVTEETIFDLSTRFLDLNRHTESRRQTAFGIDTISPRLFDGVLVTSTGIQTTTVHTSTAKTVDIGYTSSTAKGQTTTTSGTSVPMAAKDNCLKVCPCNQTTRMSEEKKAAFINEILADLNVDKKNTSAYRRQFISASDERPLSVGLGWSGAFLLVFVLGGIFVLDNERLFSDILMLFSNIKSLFKRPIK